MISELNSAIRKLTDIPSETVLGTLNPQQYMEKLNIVAYKVSKIIKVAFMRETTRRSNTEREN